jgi:alkylation response protein AidB-like acyl-CoA dehydrogenase
MTTTTPTTPTTPTPTTRATPTPQVSQVSQASQADAVLSAVRSLGPMLAAHADDIERARRLPPAVVEELTRAGCFRMLLPRRHGGDELDLVAAMRVSEELARVDGSTAWSVTIGSSTPLMFAALPEATFEAVYAAGPDVVMAGSLNPTGTAVAVDGGYRVSGRWRFASGCQHCHWVVAHCVVDDGGQPPLRVMVLPPDEVEIVDTWHVSGLCGTGSHDFTIDDVFVPRERTLSLWEPPQIDFPLVHVPEVQSTALRFAAIAVGIARAALDDVVGLSTDKVPMLDDAPLATNPWFRHHVGEADARLRAARALVYADAAEAWATAVEGRAPDLDLRARIRGTAAWAVAAAASVVDAAYDAGGGSSIRAENPLQRRWRDAHALTQHFLVKPDIFTAVGTVLTGQEPALLVF